MANVRSVGYLCNGVLEAQVISELSLSKPPLKATFKKKSLITSVLVFQAENRKDTIQFVQQITNKKENLYFKPSSDHPKRYQNVLCQALK